MITEDNKDYVSEEEKGGVADFLSRVRGGTESFLGKSVGSDESKVSWGLIVLILIGLYAVYKLIRSILFFF